MDNKLFKIEFDHLRYNIFRKNEKQKCIEAWEADIWRPVDKLLLCFNHSHCNEHCSTLQRGKLDGILQYLKDKHSSDLKMHVNESLCMTTIVIEDLRCAFEIYLKYVNTEGVLMLPMKKKLEDELSPSVKLLDDVTNSRTVRTNKAVETTACNGPNILSVLNEKCMLKIFSYLDLGELFEISTACKDFRALVRKMKKIKNIDRIDLCYRDDCFNSQGEINQSVGKMKNILNCIGDYIQEIRLSAEPHWNEYYIFNTMIKNVGKNLRTLRLSNFRWLPMLLDTTNSSVFQQIRTLYLFQQYCNNIPITIDIKAKFPNLEKLELRGKWRMINFSNWSTIDSLTLDRFISLNRISWLSWMEDVSSNFKNLQSLMVWKSVNDAGRHLLKDEVSNYECLTKLTRLKKIQMPVYQRSCFDIFLKMTRLSRMSLIFYRPIREIVEDNFFQLAICLKNLSQLELILEKSGNIIYADLIKFISLAYKLNSLHLKNMTAQTIDIGIEFLEERKKSQIAYGHTMKLNAAFWNCNINDKVIKESKTETYKHYITLTSFNLSRHHK